MQSTKLRSTFKTHVDNSRYSAKTLTRLMLDAKWLTRCAPCAVFILITKRLFLQLSFNNNDYFDLIVLHFIYFFFFCVKRIWYNRKRKFIQAAHLIVGAKIKWKRDRVRDSTWNKRFGIQFGWENIFAINHIVSPCNLRVPCFPGPIVESHTD